MNKVEACILLKERTKAYKKHASKCISAQVLANKSAYDRIKLSFDLLCKTLDKEIKPVDIEWELKMSNSEKCTILLRRVDMVLNDLVASRSPAEVHLQGIANVIRDVAIGMGVEMSEEDRRKEATDGRR